VEAQVH